MPLQVDLGLFDLENGVQVTWATCVPILVFLGLSVLELFPMYATDRETAERQTSDSIIAYCPHLGGIIIMKHTVH